MSDEIKSAYELAMEKLAKKAGTAGNAEPQKLTDDQKQRIAEIRQEYQAKLAEEQILFQSNQEGVAADPEALEKLEDGHRRDREHLEATRDKRIREIKAEG